MSKLQQAAGTDQINSLVPPVASPSTYPRMRRGWRARTSLAAPPAPCRASLRGRGRRRGCAAASQGRTGGWGTGRRPGARCCSHPAGTGAPRGHAGRHASEQGLTRQIRGPAVRRRGRTSLAMSLMSLVQKKIPRLPACQPQGERLVSAGRLTHLPLTIAWLTLFPQTSMRLRIPCTLPTLLSSSSFLKTTLILTHPLSHRSRGATDLEPLVPWTSFFAHPSTPHSHVT